MKKIFTLIAAAAMTVSISAETVFLANPDKEKENILSGTQLGADVPEGFSLQCMNTAKNLESGNEFTIDGTKYRAIKFSNGAENTITLPEGYVATKVTFYATINKDAATERPCYWAEVAGTTYAADDNNGIIDSYKDYDNPNVQSFTVPNLNSFTFKNTGEQPFAVIEVTYEEGSVTGISNIVTDENAPVEYYNLQGVRVANPANGIFFKRQGNKVEKVIVK